MKPQNVYVCSKCDYQSTKWIGRCPECGSWNSFVEETFSAKVSSESKSLKKNPAEILSEMQEDHCQRISTGISEFDRVLGGGLVLGSAVLLAGEPGIGKSTLLMQLCGKADSSTKILYVSGEESKGQIKLRAERLGCGNSSAYILIENDVSSIIREYEEVKPDVMIVDSIQTMVSDDCDSVAGSITQVRECSSKIVARAKADGAAVILVGHVNKEGGIAGPKVLEHMVDAVLYFEGDRSQSHRIVRAIKNRYGSTNEIGVFEMTDIGLEEVINPSEMLLAGRPEGVSGSCAVCVMEGSRPIISEIQALVSKSAYPTPKRMADGIDYNRMCLLLAVLEKRLGLKFSDYDVYLNVIGGLKIDDNAADAAIALALCSTFNDIPVSRDLIVVGEIGLSGEIRSVTCTEQRTKESSRIGFNKIALPKRGLKNSFNVSSEIVPISSVYDLILLLSKNEKQI